MVHKETVDIFVDIFYNESYKVDAWFEYKLPQIIGINGSDLFVYPEIPDNIKYTVKGNFNLSMDEEILFFRDTSFWNERNQGLVITDCRVVCIPDNDKPNEVISFTWENVDHVEYIDECLYFFGEQRDDNCPIHLSYFLKDVNETNKKKWAGELFSILFSKLANSQIIDEDIFEKTVERYNTLINEGKEDEALQLALNFRKKEHNVALTPEIAWLYHKKGQDEKAFAVIDEDFNALSEDNLTWKGKLYYTKYSIYDDNGDYTNARKDCLYVKRNIPSDVNWDYEDVNILDDATKDFSRFENEYTQHFLEQPYNERKLIVPVRSYSDLYQKKLAVIDINNLPTVNFPMGHPIANQLYVGHPYIPSKYIPFENYELELIEDKIREFSQIMQCLGATEINIESVNSSSNNKDVKIDQKLSGGVDYKFMSASGNCERHITNKLLEDISQHINLHQKFSPKKYPALPENLVWYQNEPSWQRLYSQRMQGALLEHEERIETKKSQVVENSELKQISAEVKWLFVQANGNWEQSMEEKFEAHENAILSIHVKFAPLESLQMETLAFEQKTNPTLSALSQLLTEEVEYLDELKACLEEGSEISPKERRLLNRLRERLGITEDRAEELEASLLKPQITEEEQEYLDEYKACIEEGELSPKEIRLLNRLRMSLGISEDRAKELEAFI